MTTSEDVAELLRMIVWLLLFIVAVARIFRLRDVCRRHMPHIDIVAYIELAFWNLYVLCWLFFS